MDNKSELMELQKKNLEYLDKIDFLPYLEKIGELHDLMHDVSWDYYDTDFTANAVLDGEVFNWIDENDVMKYLHKRYPEYSFYVQEYYEPPILIKKDKLHGE